MANNFSTNPMVIDSVMSATAKNSGATYTGQYRIKAIHWDNNNAAPGGQATLLDELGNPFWSETAASSQFATIVPPQVVNDFKCTVLAQGKIYIYLV